ncbi:coiled-coil domain-containing protein 1-like [Panicum virgatum]|uniref:Uncharacterized protein n=1 Tax=Panicum virgatum TaxID=38727 RepID=A0A8T0RXX9_PANVG|nr:coiled-coil domain-containing protein 1-like [Panicum virgatum]KAG2589476.1 hypothetical protein PVAP13_5NG362900 [Panicum virgatum]
MPHGKLGIADGAISISEKETIKTRKRCAQPNTTAREKRLERENKELRKENDRYQELQRVVRALAAKGGMDYDALAKETVPNLDAEFEDAVSQEHDGIGHDISGQENIDRIDCRDEDNEGYNDNDEGYNVDDEGYNDDDEGYMDNEDDENYRNYGRDSDDEDYNLW